MMTTNARRVQWSKQETIKAPASEIFPLLCPILEEKWIPNWQYELVYSDSGVNEPDCIFTEEVSGPFVLDTPLTTVWNTIVHDPENKRITFLLVHGDRGVTRINAKVELHGKATSTINWDMVFTSLNPKTDELSDDRIRQGLAGFADYIVSLLKHYCETGKMLQN